MGMIKTNKMLQRHKDAKFFFVPLCLCGKIFFRKTKLKSLFILVTLFTVSCKTRQSVVTPTTSNVTAAGIASARQYNLFLLQGNNTNCLNGSPKTFLTTPGNSTQCRLMAAYLSDTYPASPAMVIYRDNNKKESDLADLFFSYLD